MTGGIALAWTAPLWLRVERPGLFAWAFPLALLAVFIAVRLYRREQIGRRSRAALTGLRVAAVAWAVFMLTRGVGLLQHEHTDRSVVALLIDTSASMGTEDMPGGSRSEAFVASWKRAFRDGPGFQASGREWRAYGFDRELRELGGSGSAQLAAESSGRGTDIAGAIRMLLSRADAGRVTDVVLASDGRSSCPADWDAFLQLASRAGTVIHTVPLGDEHPRPSITLGPAWAPAKTFSYDSVRVQARVSAHGLTGKRIRIEMHEPETGALLASREVTVSVTPRAGDPEATGFSAVTEIHLRPLVPGRHKLELRATAEDGTTAAPLPLEIESVEHRLRVLYVEGYPRFEYRYLRTLLSRDQTLSASCLLLSADPEFQQEGAAPIQRFPETAEDLAKYDVIILGDVDARGAWWHSEQSRLIEDFVSRRGGGLIVLAGRRWMPAATQGTPLEKLLPVELDIEARGRLEPEPFAVTATPAAISVLAVVHEETSEPRDWLNTRPGLYWSMAIARVKPGAQVLIERQGESGPSPIVVLGRYGSGRVLLHGTDETWRWRREIGERYHEGYWLGALRCVARGRLGEDGSSVLQLEREEYEIGYSIPLRIPQLPPELLGDPPAQIRVLVRDAAGAPVGRTVLTRAETGDGYAGIWLPPVAGEFSLAIDEPGQPQLRAATQRVRVVPDSAETRDTRPDFATLARISQATGGKCLRLDQLSELPGELHDRPERRVVAYALPFWDTSLAWGVLVILLSAEWVLRKRWGLI